VEASFGWTDKDLQLMQTWIYVSYLLDMLPFTWLMDRKGDSVSQIHFWATVCKTVRPML